jgi:hypothetical protein
MKGQQPPRPSGARATSASNANAVRRGRWALSRTAVGCRELARLHRSRGSGRAASAPDCDSAIRSRSSRRRGPQLRDATDLRQTRQFRLARRRTQASPRPTNHHGPGAERQGFRPCCATTDRARRSAARRWASSVRASPSIPSRMPAARATFRASAALIAAPPIGKSQTMRLVWLRVKLPPVWHPQGVVYPRDQPCNRATHRSRPTAQLWGEPRSYRAAAHP